MEEAIEKCGQRKVKKKNGRNEEASLLIVDFQSVKNADTLDAKGYDAGKKASDIKRHIAVDRSGLPHGLDITTVDSGKGKPCWKHRAYNVQTSDPSKTRSPTEDIREKCLRTK